MNIFYGSSSSTAWSVSRIISMLDKYLPEGMTRVHRIEEAGLVVLHVTGRNEHTTHYAQDLCAQGKQYAIIQYSLKSTRNPDPRDWAQLWKRAKVVWSYYDLKEYMNNFYHAPLGAGSDLFYQQDIEKKYLVGSIGNTYRAECIGEVQIAAWKAKGRAVHIGETFSNPVVDYFINISDDEMRVIMNRCKYFSALRRKEGFEMQAVEALLCGVRPIMFDTPNYRQWFDGLAEFIPESSVIETGAHIQAVLKRDPRPVTHEEILEVRTRFDWEKSVKGFWERCL